MNGKQPTLLAAIMVTLAAVGCVVDETGIDSETGEVTPAEFAAEESAPDSGLECELTLLPKTSRPGPTLVGMTLTNKTETAMSLLARGLPFHKTPVQMYSVERDGEPVRFYGIDALFPPPGESDFVLFEPGEALFASYELSMFFPLDEPGEYTVTLQNERVTTARADLTGQHSATMKCNSVHFTFEMADTEKFAPPSPSAMGLASHDTSDVPALDPMAVRSAALSDAGQSLNAQKSSTSFPLAYDYCQEWQAIDLLSASTLLWDVGPAAMSEASSYPTGGIAQRWFGVRDNIRHYLASVYTGWITAWSQHPYFNCNNSCWDVTAYVFRWRDDFIHLCMPYWYLDTGGRGGKMAVIAHELAHVSNIDADDYVYGQPLSLGLALQPNYFALDNADNYNFFYGQVQERVPAGAAGGSCFADGSCASGLYCWAPPTSSDGAFCRVP